jgi:NDP-sugar pyrophosphorylase family protein
MKRQRITVTLQESLLKELDKSVDGRNVRNRSHAVELALSKVLLNKPVKVLILAGGKQLRPQPLGREMPKGLLPISGRPLLEHTILRLKSSGLEDIVISVGQGGQKIKDYFRNGSRLGVNITYLEQSGIRHGTAQPLREAKSLFLSGEFILIYGDVLADINYQDFLEFHRTQKKLVATMALASAERASMWGIAKLVGNKVTEFEEKPKNTSIQSHLVNAGIYIMEPEIFEYLNSKMQKLESELFPRLAEESKLGGYSFGGDWRDVSF